MLVIGSEQRQDVAVLAAFCYNQSGLIRLKVNYFHLYKIIYIFNLKTKTFYKIFNYEIYNI